MKGILTATSLHPFSDHHPQGRTRTLPYLSASGQGGDLRLSRVLLSPPFPARSSKSRSSHRLVTIINENTQQSAYQIRRSCLPRFSSCLLHYKRPRAQRAASSPRRTGFQMWVARLHYAARNHVPHSVSFNNLSQTIRPVSNAIHQQTSQKIAILLAMAPTTISRPLCPTSNICKQR